MHLSGTLVRLLFYLGAGGLFSAAAIPQGEVSRGFFRFSAALFAAVLAIGALVGRSSEVPVVLGAFAAAALLAAGQAALVRSLGTRRGRALIALAALSALSGTAVAGFSSASAHQGTGGLLGGAAALSSALLLGSAITSMTLGHWYLVMPALPPDPLLRLTRLYAASVAARALATGAVFACLALRDERALDRFVAGAGPILWARILFGIAMPAVLALMALPTVRVRDTQPATGMLYVACVLVLVGEGIGRYLEITTGVPI